MKIPAGATNVSVYYYIVQDASNTSPGEPVTGLLFSDIETGGSASYARQGAARVDLELITLASASATHADGGFILVDDTNMPGLYRCDYPDAAFASGIDQVFLQIVIASGKNAVAAPILVDIEASIAQTEDNDTKLTTLLARIIGTLESGSHNPQSGDAFARLATYRLGELMSEALASQPFTTSLMGDLTQDNADDTGTQQFTVAALMRLADEVLTGATHNITNSWGRKVRQLTSIVVRQNTAQGPGTGNNQIQLDTGASAVDGEFDPSLIFIESGTGIGQSRGIIDYNGTTKTATVDRDWRVNPDATSGFIILADAGRESVNEGLAQGGTSNTITLNSTAASGDGTYIDQLVFIRSGLGQDQVGVVIAYNGTTKVATISKNWIVNPDTTSGYVVLPSSDVALMAGGLDAIIVTDIGTVEIAKAVWDRVLTGATHNIVNSAGRRIREVIDSVVLSSDNAQSATINTITLASGEPSVDGTYDPSHVTIVGGLGAGQTRLVLQYEGSTRIATVDRNWKITPDATSVYTITSDAGREHVNEGLAQGGTANTVTLNTLASSIDGIYNGQIVFIRSGKGDDQAKLILAYNGTTKVATIDTPWGIVPDTTSAYVMLPSSPIRLSTLTQASIDAIETAVVTDIPSSIAALPTASEINLEMVDVMETDTHAELSAVPAATVSYQGTMLWNFALQRNKLTTTATILTVRNDGDSGDIAAANINDNGTTFTREEFL